MANILVNFASTKIISVSQYIGWNGEFSWILVKIYFLLYFYSKLQIFTRNYKIRFFASQHPDNRSIREYNLILDIAFYIHSLYS